MKLRILIVFHMAFSLQAAVHDSKKDENKKDAPRQIIGTSEREITPNQIVKIYMRKNGEEIIQQLFEYDPVWSNPHDPKTIGWLFQLAPSAYPGTGEKILDLYLRKYPCAANSKLVNLNKIEEIILGQSIEINDAQMMGILLQHDADPEFVTDKGDPLSRVIKNCCYSTQIDTCFSLAHLLIHYGAHLRDNHYQLVHDESSCEHTDRIIDRPRVKLLQLCFKKLTTECREKNAQNYLRLLPAELMNELFLFISSPPKKDEAK